MSAKLGELISGIICTALSLVAAYLTLILFYGIVLMVFHYAFGIELWESFSRQQCRNGRLACERLTPNEALQVRQQARRRAAQLERGNGRC